MARYRDKKIVSLDREISYDFISGRISIKDNMEALKQTNRYGSVSRKDLKQLIKGSMLLREESRLLISELNILAKDLGLEPLPDPGTAPRRSMLRGNS